MTLRRKLYVPAAVLAVAAGIAAFAMSGNAEPVTAAQATQPAYVAPAGAAGLSKLDCGGGNAIESSGPTIVPRNPETREPVEIVRAHLSMGEGKKNFSHVVAAAAKPEVASKKISGVHTEVVITDDAGRVVGDFWFIDHPDAGTILDFYAFCAK